MGRHKTWRFASLLLVTPDLSQCIDDAHRSADVVKHHLLSQFILNSTLPDHIFNVEVRYRLSDLDAACTKLPFEGYVQSSEKLEEYILQRWFNAEWSPVGGKCCRSPAYQIFRVPHPDYRHLSLHEKPALNKGGRPSKKKEVPFSHLTWCYHSAESAPDKKGFYAIRIAYDSHSNWRFT
jgi:hypothetical protein